MPVGNPLPILFDRMKISTSICGNLHCEHCYVPRGCGTPKTIPTDTATECFATPAIATSTFSPACWPSMRTTSDQPGAHHALAERRSPGPRNISGEVLFRARDTSPKRRPARWPQKTV